MLERAAYQRRRCQSQAFSCLRGQNTTQFARYDDGMAPLQGPAVVLFNDAEFSKTDWHNYTQKVGDSSKADDPDTAGKLGKGALTAYSFSDVIQVLSGENLLVLDPHGKHLPEDLQSWGCNFVARKSSHYVNLACEAPGQIDPFTSFTESCTALPGLATGSPYPGTIFRLALRTEDAAKSSDISNDFITTSQVEQTLEEFAAAAPDLLLFLRHVNKISVYIKEDGQHAAILKHECKAASFMHSSSGLRQMLSVRIKGDNNASSRVWLKVTDPAKNGDGIVTLLQESTSTEQLPTLSGKVYSTMALPFEDTGLPVHVNGAFFMSSDRRNLWEGEGDEGKVQMILFLSTTDCLLWPIASLANHKADMHLVPHRCVSLYFLQGAKNRQVLMENIAPAWANSISWVCSMNLLAAGSKIVNIYR